LKIENEPADANIHVGIAGLPCNLENNVVDVFLFSLVEVGWGTHNDVKIIILFSDSYRCPVRDKMLVENGMLVENRWILSLPKYKSQFKTK
jgi:hypothetical protein